ncbi:tetratricopeptide repeat protein [Sinosporangium siamense]|uniref:Ancillary SecYEG translocon subunit/Cell division coordinator CpoB TPR domain-containing protein n=1 Tax=Sinosporangium siamense TaxID=1367973 RepID=A0A919VBH9_9ACTN|nr:tetratricopeptide repeat protein [Sinosporangium siamense]GII97413.1 hypothetical protein Ssi02_76440 [Sinosporangium siamense]
MTPPELGTLPHGALAEAPAPPEDGEAGPREDGPLATARALAESGDLAGAAHILSRLVDDDTGPDRAQAAVGLAVVLEESGDLGAARAAARIALATGHPEFAPQAACHLARGFERDELFDQARAAWQAALGSGHASYVPLAHLALARLSEDEGDGEAAERSLRAAISTGDPEIGSLAAQRLAELLLSAGEAAEAAGVLVHALSSPETAESPRLRVLLGIAHLELACAEFTTAVEEADETDTAATALAIELLARTLPLRGRDEDAEHVWNYGLGHEQVELAHEVALRRDRGVTV